MGTAAPTLVFVESESDLGRLRELARGGPDGSFTVVALSPEAEYALEKAGLPFVLVDDYYTEEEITQAGIANYERVERFCEYVDGWLAQRSDAIKTCGVTPARFHYFALKILLDAVSLRALILKRILAQESPATVLSAPAPLGDDPADPFLLFRGSIYARLLPLVSASLNLPFSAWKLQTDGETNGSEAVMADAVNSGRSGGRSLSVFSERWKAFRVLASGATSLFWAWVEGSLVGNASTVLVADINDRETQLIMQRLFETRGARLRFLYWPRTSGWAISFRPMRLVRLGQGNVQAAQVQSMAEQAPVLWEQLTADDGVRRFLEWEGVDLFPAMESRLRRLLFHGLPQPAGVYLRAKALFNQEQVRVVLLSQVALPWQKAVCAAAKEAGVTVVNQQHGAEGERLCPIVFYTECEGPDYLLTYGTGMEDFCRRHYSQGAVPVPTGSPALDQLELARQSEPGRARLFRRLGLDSGKKTVVYCPTAVYGSKYYVSYSYPKSDSAYFHIQRRIVETFKDYPSFQFVVKQNIGTRRSYPLHEFIRDRGIGNCKLVTEEPSFVELLSVADLVILDSPTLTFLETLAMGKPVLVFNNWLRWEPESLDLLKRSAVFSDDHDEFIGILRSYLATGHFEEARRDGTAYLRRFGTYLGDGRSAERAAEAIERVARTGVVN